MHFLILGGSGRTGKLVIEEALSKSHTLTALVRNPSSLSETPGLTIIKGSPLIPADIETAITSSPTPPAAILVTLNSVRKSDNPFSAPVSPPTMMVDTHTNLVAAMKTHGIKKLVTMSAFGVGDSHDNVFCPTRLVLDYTNVAVAYKDHNAVEKVVRDSGLDWTLVRPAMLSEGKKKEVKTWESGKGIGMMPSVSRASVAGFLVECGEGDEWNGVTPVISE